MQIDLAYDEATSGVPRFTVDTSAPPDVQAARFAGWCAESGFAPDHFCCMSEPLQEYWQAFARALSLPAMSADLTRALRHKPTMKRWIRTADLTATEFTVHRSMHNALAFAETVGFPLVGKPVDGWGARETTVISDNTALRRWALAHTQSGMMMLEAMVSYEEYECCALIARGAVLDRYVSMMPARPMDAAHGAINANISLAACREHEPSSQLDAMVRRLVSHFGIDRGYLHMEFFASPTGGLVVSELAVRYPGCEIAKNHGLALGFDIAQATLDVYLGRVPDLDYGDHRCVGDLLLPYRPGTIVAITGAAEVESMDGVLEAHMPAVGDVLPDVDAAAYNCAGWVFVEGPDPPSVERRMRAVLDSFTLETTQRESGQ
jgi:biotin carboxylase